MNRYLHSRTRYIVLISMLIVLLMVPAARLGTRPATAQGGPLFEDAFTDNHNNWESVGASANMTIEDGKLNLSVEAEDKIGMATVEKRFPDAYKISVDLSAAPTVKNSKLWNAGLLLRMSGLDFNADSYQFDIAGDGTWGFGIYTNDDQKYTILKSGSIDNFDPKATYTLAVTLAGDTFLYEVNGTQVGTFTDRTLTSDTKGTYVGLLAGTSKGLAGVNSSFSNLSVEAYDPSGDTSILSKEAQGSAGDVLLADDFSGTDNNWSLIGKGTFDIQDNALTLNVEGPSLAHVATPDLLFPDNLEITVDITALPSPKTNKQWYAGFVFRMNGRTNYSPFYEFDYTGDGKWAFALKTARGKDYNSIKEGTLKDFDPLQSHTLKIQTKGSNFTLYIDDAQVGIFTDRSLPAGGAKTYVGLLAGTFKDANKASVQFSNLKVTALGD